MSNIPKTNFGQISFKETFACVGLNAWGVGNMPRDATSQMEKDEDLQKMIRSTRYVYARQLKMAWDVKN